MRTTTWRVAAAAALAVVSASLSAAGAAPLRCPQTSGGVPVMTWAHAVRTGHDGGVRIPYTNVDTDWFVVPGNGPTYSVSPHSAWTAPIATDANWINSKTTYSSNGTTGGIENHLPTELSGPVAAAAAAAGPVVGPAAPTTTRFRTYFTVPQHSFLAQLTLDYAADNGVTFYLNGAPIGGYDPPVADPSAFQTLRQLVWAGQFLTGVNTLDAVVTDHGVATGVYVDGSATACTPALVQSGICVEVRRDGLGLVTYSPAPIDLGTGETGYVPHAYTTPDDDWRTVAPVAGDAFSVAPNTKWVSSTASNWINSATTRSSGTGVWTPIEIDGSGVSVSGGALPATTVRTFAVDFTLPSFWTYADLDLRYAADNGVDFYLNGVPIGGFTPPPGPNGAGDWTAFGLWHSLLHAGAGFQAGTNTLTAVVTDYGVDTGLIVEGGARVCPAKGLG